MIDVTRYCSSLKRMMSQCQNKQQPRPTFSCAVVGVVASSIVVDADDGADWIVDGDSVVVGAEQAPRRVAVGPRPQPVVETVVVAYGDVVVVVVYVFANALKNGYYDFC